jgi:hypothetical protein
MRQIRTSSTAVSQIRRHGTNEYYGSTPDVLTPKMVVALIRMSGRGVK